MGRGGAIAVVVVVGLLAAGRAAAQAPAAGVAPAGGIEPPLPPAFSGSSSFAPFNEKALFPAPAPGPKKDPAAPAVVPPLFPPGSVVLPPPEPPPGEPPGPPRVITIPDGKPPVPPADRRWTGGFEFGINGSDGNVNVMNVRTSVFADRRAESNLFHIDLVYNLGRFDGENTQNQAILNVREELRFADARWSVFSAGQVEYDEFRVYNLRAGAYAGLSYQWWKTDNTLFKSRLGAGASRELATEGGAPNRWVPEALVGLDFNHRFTDRQQFISSLDLYPNVGQLGRYRVRARAGYEIVIDPSHGLVLRLGVQDRFDSNPGPAKRNDVNFFTSLLFKF